MEAPARAGVADEVDRAEVAHADFVHARSLARLAPAPGRVEREVPLAESQRPGLGRRGEEVAHVVEGAGVGRRVRAGSAADRIRVDRDDPREGAVGAQPLDGGREQRGLAGAGDSRDEVEGPEAKDQRGVDDGVPGEAVDREELALLARAVSDAMRLGAGLLEQPPAGRRVGTVRAEKPGRRAGEEQASARRPGAGAEVDQPVGVQGELRVVVDHDDRLPPVAQAAENPQQPRDVVRVQAGARLVQDDDEPAQLAESEREEAQPLPLAGREGRSGAVEGEVPDAELVHQRAAREEVRADRREDGAVARDAGQQAVQVAGRESGQLGDRTPLPAHRAGLGAQARAVAGAAGARPDEAEDRVVALAAEDLLHHREKAAVVAVLPGPGRDARSTSAGSRAGACRTERGRRSDPWSTTPRASSESSRHGTSTEPPCARSTSSSTASVTCEYIR